MGECVTPWRLLMFIGLFSVSKYDDEAVNLLLETYGSCLPSSKLKYLLITRDACWFSLCPSMREGDLDRAGRVWSGLESILIGRVDEKVGDL